MMQSNIKIAIAGGICSGKSTVANIIREQGYKVISCDEIYTELLTDTNFIKLLDNEFGCVENTDGTLNRTRLSEIVFNDSEKLRKLNLITHPKIMQKAMAQMTGEGIHFCEVPLLFENGFEKLFDSAIVVLRDEAERAKVLIERNGIDRKQAILRIKSQFDYQNNSYIEYYVIDNNTNLLDLRSKTLNVLEKITKQYN